MGLADILDILVFAVLVYGIIILLRQTKSLFIVYGIAILSIVYALAQFFDFTLTAAVFQSFFGVLLIALVVIFQVEIRRFFEMVALWGSALRKKIKIPTKPEYVENIVHAVEKLAQQRTGLIIVVAGRESLNRYLQGGFDLNGKISEPLLQSIFDPSSPGHDGAVIIESDLVTKFGTHLPLSKDFRQIQNYGTRHSAALGIAEVSDALSVLVSEERGSMALARDGHLKQISDAVQLQSEIETFLREKFTTTPLKAWWKLWFTENTHDKFLAFVIAVVAWLLFVWPGK